MIKLAFLWNHVKKHKMILRSRYFASSGCVLIFPLNCPTSITGSIIDWQGLVRVEARVVTNVNEVQCTLSLYIYYAGRVGFSFIKWSRRVKSLSNHLDTRDTPLEIDETKLYALEVQESSSLVFSSLSLSEILAGATPDKYRHVPLSVRVI